MSNIFTYLASHAKQDTTGAKLDAPYDDQMLIQLRPSGTSEHYKEDYKTWLSPCTRRDYATGIYLYAGESVECRLRQGQFTYAVIGTENAFVGKTNSGTQNIPLVPGTQTITSTMDGILYLCNDSMTIPATIELHFYSNQKRVIMFDAAKNTDDEWNGMLAGNPNAKAVELQGDHSLVTVTYSSASRYEKYPKETINLLDRIVELENQLAGVIDGMPGVADGTGVTHHLLEANADFMYATNGYTAYRPGTAVSRVLDLNSLTNQGWGPYHEIGHQHQQYAWKFGGSEVTVNLYSAYVQSIVSNSANGNIGATASDAYAGDTSGTMTWDDLGVADKLSFFTQPLWAFGVDFYQILHQFYRVMPRSEVPSADLERRELFVLTASKICGFNLVPYVETWRFFTVTQDFQNAINSLNLQPLPIDLAEFRIRNTNNQYVARQNLAGLDGTYTLPKAYPKNDFILRQGETPSINSLISYDSSDIANATILDNVTAYPVGEARISVKVEDNSGNTNIVPVYGLIVPSEYSDLTPAGIVAKADQYIDAGTYTISTLEQQIEMLAASVTNEYDLEGTRDYKTVIYLYSSLIDQIQMALSSLSSADISFTNNQVSLSLDIDVYQAIVGGGKIRVKIYIDDSYQGEVVCTSGGVTRYYSGRFKTNSQYAIFYCSYGTPPENCRFHIEFTAGATMDVYDVSAERSESTAEGCSEGIFFDAQR